VWQFEPKLGKELALPSISVDQKDAPQNLTIVTMLANTSLRAFGFSVPKLRRKKKSEENLLKRLKFGIDYPVPNVAPLVCIPRALMAQSPPVSSRGKQFLDTCSECQLRRAFQNLFLQEEPKLRQNRGIFVSEASESCCHRCDHMNA
jgi:hypothetical protein